MDDGHPEIEPTPIPRHPTRMNGTAPAVRWAYDILEPAGEEGLRRILQEIKDECAFL